MKLSPLWCLQLINSWCTVPLSNHPSLNSRFQNSQRWSFPHHGFLVPGPPFCVSNAFPHHTLNLTITNDCTSIISGSSTKTPVIFSPNFPDNSAHPSFNVLNWNGTKMPLILPTSLHPMPSSWTLSLPKPAYISQSLKSQTLYPWTHG